MSFSDLSSQQEQDFFFSSGILTSVTTRRCWIKVKPGLGISILVVFSVWSWTFSDIPFSVLPQLLNPSSSFSLFLYFFYLFFFLCMLALSRDGKTTKIFYLSTGTVLKNTLNEESLFLFLFIRMTEMISLLDAVECFGIRIFPSGRRP